MTPSRISVAVSLCLTLACGASGSGTSSTGGAQGKVTVLLKDAPADVQSAVVTISEVDLVGDAGKVVLRDTPVTTDLLTLAHDVATLVDGATVPAGTYTQLRFVIDGGYLDVAGTIYASSDTYAGLPAGATVGGKLQMPSYAQSGLKVLLPGGGLVVGADTHTLLVDFDVAESFGHGAGKSGKWVMHPVIKATQVDGPAEPPPSATTGDVEVTLTDMMEVPLPGGVTLDQFQATLTPAAGGTAITLALVSDGNGACTATFSGLAVGEYAVSFVAPAGLVGTPTYNPAIPDTVAVVAGQTLSSTYALSALETPL